MNSGLRGPDVGNFYYSIAEPPPPPPNIYDY